MSIQLEDVTSGYGLSIINTNFEKIEAYINAKLLARADTGVAGEAKMERDLDMNSFAILNLKVSSDPNSMVTKGYVDAADGELDGRITALEDTVLTPLSSYYWYVIPSSPVGFITPPVSFTYANVFLDGIAQIPGYSFTISGGNIVFANTVPAGTRIYAILGEMVNGATGDYVSVDTYQVTLDALADLTASYDTVNTGVLANTAAIAALTANKADASTVLLKANNLSDVASVSTARTNLGLGGAAVLNVGTAAGTVAAGNDARLDTVNGKTAGVVNTTSALFNLRGDNTDGTGQIGGYGKLSFNPATHNLRGFDFYPQIYTATNLQYVWMRMLTGPGAVAKTWHFEEGGNMVADGGSFVSNSDERLKYNIAEIENPLEILEGLRGCTFNYKEDGRAGIGLIAQDVEKFYPNNVYPSPVDKVMPDGEVVEGALALNAGDIAAGVLTAACKALLARIKELETKVAALTPSE